VTELADPKITVRYVAADGKLLDRADGRQTYPPPPLRPEVLQPLEQVAKIMWPGVPIIPSMGAGATDGVYTNAAGLPTYGVLGDAIDRDDLRAHGRDERMGVQAFYDGVEFFYRYLKAVTSGP
jgi:acetylornithine deacetylase/succinyl-diaminopimelate desuccinylase-like protein